MKYGVGIDTGGTYTDAVIYEFDSKKVVEFCKSPTTKDDLSVGILRALDGLDDSLVRQAEIISLSTTLATNACVEDKGARSKLLFIGVDPRTVDWVGGEAGLDNAELLRYAAVDRQAQTVDWDAYVLENREWLEDAQALAIVDFDASTNQALWEKTARDAVKAHYPIPVICGYELSAELNSIRRGASALLNGRLIPVLAEFLEAIRTALQKRGIAIPVAIMRSDGTLMSERFTSARPVETVLCGPAASVVGGCALQPEENALIVDMGGTTTDIAFVRDSVPVKAGRGIQIGRWHTAVKGVYVHTLGLGGDSAVRFDRMGKPFLDSTRVMPLCAVGARWPEVRRKLIRMLMTTPRHTQPLHEFIVGVKNINEGDHYSAGEKALCKALADGPLILREAADVLGVDLYKLDTRRLEREGIILRAGLTPTDIMHLVGDFSAYPTECAELGAGFVARSVMMDVPELCATVYDLVKKKLFLCIAEMLLREEIPAFEKSGLDGQMQTLLEHTWEMTKRGRGSQLNLQLRTASSLVGVGAPIHIFLPDVARALGTNCVIPELAGVVNAVGAVAGNVSHSSTVNVRPTDSGFITYGATINSRFYNLEEAVAAAKEAAEKEVRAEAAERGASGKIIVRHHANTQAALNGYGREMYLGTQVTATAIGALVL